MRIIRVMLQSTFPDLNQKFLMVLVNYIETWTFEIVVLSSNTPRSFSISNSYAWDLDGYHIFRIVKLLISNSDNLDTYSPMPCDDIILDLLSPKEL